MILQVAKRIANIRFDQNQEGICFSCADRLWLLYRQDTGRNREDRISCRLCSFQPEQVKIERKRKVRDEHRKI